MKQQHAVVVLFALIIISTLTSFHSFRETRRMVNDDMNRALAITLQQQRSDVISADTIRVFNSHLQLEGLKGRAAIAVDAKKGFTPRPQVSTATIFSLSDQRPSLVLWSVVLLWSLFCVYRHRQQAASGMFGGLALIDGRFVDAKGCVVRLTPMQQQLLEMLWQSPSRQLSKTEICVALWPKKENASETLYTLVRRLKPIVEQHSRLKIEVERGRSYGLTVR